MAGWRAPTLTETFGSSTWTSELETNMTNIRVALDALESFLGALDLTRLGDYSSLFVRKYPLFCQIDGVVTTGLQKVGFICPFNGVVDKAYARCNTAPNGDGAVYIDIERGGFDTQPNESIISAPLTVDNNLHGAVVSAEPATDAVFRAGDFLQIRIEDSTGGLGVTEVAEDLQVVLVTEPRDWLIYGA